VFPAAVSKYLTLAPVGFKILPTLLGSLNDQEIITSLAALGLGPKVSGFVPVLQELRAAHQGNKPLESVLDTPAAQKFIESLHKKNEEANNCVFMKCPLCEQNFETELVERPAGSQS